MRAEKGGEFFRAQYIYVTNDDADVFYPESQEDLALLENCGIEESKIDTDSKNLVKWLAVRAARNELISACDWTQMPDSPLTAEQKTAWAEYRQALRDIPDVYDDPDDVVWPEKPTL